MTEGLFPPEQLSQYFLLLNPGPITSEFVKNKKVALRSEIGNYDSQNSIPHISLGKFIIPEYKEDKILDNIASSLSTFSPFLVHTTGIACWENSGTICITTSKDEIIALGNLLRQILRTNEIRKYSNFLHRQSDTSHVTIAKRLNKQQFEVAKNLLGNISFQDQFKVDEVIVLKWDNAYGQWKECRRIPLVGNDLRP